MSTAVQFTRTVDRVSYLEGFWQPPGSETLLLGIFSSLHALNGGTHFTINQLLVVIAPHTTAQTGYMVHGASQSQHCMGNKSCVGLLLYSLSLLSH